MDDWWRWETQSPRVRLLRTVAWAGCVGFYVWALATGHELPWLLAVAFVALFFLAPPGRVLVAPLTQALTRRADRLR